MSDNVAVAQWIEWGVWELRDPGLIPGQGELFTLKFILRGNETNGKEQEQQVIPWSLANCCRQ